MAAFWEGVEMKLFQLSALILAGSLLLPHGHPARAEFTIVPRVDQNAGATFAIERMHAFEANVSLNVRTDPRLVPTARLIEMVESIDLRDGAGIEIRSGYAIDPAHDLVVAWSGGTAEITRVQATPQGLLVAGLFKDRAGRIVTPPTQSLAAYTTAGQRLCFRQTTIDRVPQTLPMLFAILIDKSGSMDAVMPTVKDAALGFIDTLPDSARCAVGAFADQPDFSRASGLANQACRRGDFDLSGIVAGGKTNLYGAMSALYAWMADPKWANHQKAVIVISDGQANENTATLAATQALKGDAVTFVYFLGARENRWLKSLADQYLDHQGNLTAQLSRYFGVLGTAYAQQTVLELTTCPAGGAGIPHGRP